MDEAHKFAGRTALVTGGSAGIGRAVCESLLNGGAHVVAVSRETAPFSHERLQSRVVDLADPAATRAAAAEIVAAQKIDILVNNAGIVRNTLVEDVADDEYDTLFDLHVRAALILTQAVVPAMKAQGFGRIVTMSSRAIVGLAQRTVYAATKAALVAMTRTWALELGPHGITVNAIAPGPIETAMLTAEIPVGSEKYQRLAASLPARRLGRPDDIARAVMFFADPQNDWVTGQTLFVCGGSSLGMSTAL